MEHIKEKATILGLGYLGVRIAKHLENLGYSIVGTTRSKNKVKNFKDKNWNVILWSESNLSLESKKKITKTLFLDSSVIISTIPPLNTTKQNSEIIDPVHLKFSDALKKSKAWKGYISSTSVYGGKNGDSFHEDSNTFPKSKRGKYRLEAENYWKKCDAEILRSAAIYGPHRSIIYSLINKTTTPIIKKNFKFNRIYVDDLVGVIIKAISKPRKGRIINLADGQPSTQIKLWREAEKITGIIMPKPIEFKNAVLSEKAKSFWQNWRVIEPKVIKEELKYKFKFPNYKEGLKQCWKEEKAFTKTSDYY